MFFHVFKDFKLNYTKKADSVGFFCFSPELCLPKCRFSLATLPPCRRYMSMKKKKEQDEEKPKVHPDLDGFEVKINSFGEIVSNYDMDKINEFLNKNVVDKKLKDREGYKSDEEDEVDE